MPNATGRNRLGAETSPYLLQHKDNPVHWWPWGAPALAAAKSDNKPILLSVGYAACHWCHVMAHESFEDDQVAALMNDHFINIKVDREERPDIDAIYMGALHRLGEHGGWPLTMFLDTEARPFWGGTYFPPQDRHGRPSFTRVLTEIARIWREEPAKVHQNAQGLARALADSAEPGLRMRIDDDLLRGLVTRLVEAFDDTHGGIRGAPKFPQWTIFWLLWRSAIRHDNKAARDAVVTTLTHICQGGIYDHLGGGFARYAVDQRWLVPHFEKMLYDNALLLDLLTEAWRETKNPLFASRVAETVGWLEREMVAPGGGFAASLDADSEGEEGKFYLWSKAEVIDVLGARDGATFCEAYDVTEAGNFEGHNILNRLHALEMLTPAQEDHLASLRTKLFDARALRQRPGWDDKVLADWNGLTIAAVTNAARAFEHSSWLSLAERAFDVVVGAMQVDGRLRHAHRAGVAKVPATAADYAFMIWAALRLHAATNGGSYLNWACQWVETLDRHYWSSEAGGYHMTADDTADVIVRLRQAGDDAVPNANTVMISNLVQLSMITGRHQYLQRAEAIPNAFASDLQRNLVQHCGLLAAAFDLLSPQHIVIGGDREIAPTRQLAQVLNGLSLPGAVWQVSAGSPAEIAASPGLAGKGPAAGRSAAYICIGNRCSAPITDPKSLSESLLTARQQ